MEQEPSVESIIKEQVEWLFIEAALSDSTARMDIGAFILGKLALDLRDAKEKQSAQNQKYTEESEVITEPGLHFFSPYFTGYVEPSPALPHSETELTEVEKAEVALRRAKQEAKTTYGLNTLQVAVALYRGRRNLS